MGIYVRVQLLQALKQEDISDVKYCVVNLLSGHVSFGIRSNDAMGFLSFAQLQSCIAFLHFGNEDDPSGALPTGFFSRLLE